MTSYLYRARDTQGALVTGELEAATPDEIRIRLADQGLIPLAVKPAAIRFEIPFLKRLFAKKVSSSELIIMTRQFYSLFKAGMNIEAILATLIRQTTNKALHAALQRIRADVGAGASLSQAFSKHPTIFSDLYINMMVAGEEAGILEEVLANLCRTLEKETEIKASVKSATLYPKIVVFVIGVATAVLMTVVVPKFAKFYAHYNHELPLPTRILIKTSETVTDYWYLVGLGLLGAAVAFSRWARTARGAAQLGQLRFRLPVFGPLELKVANARFSHLLASLYKSGLPMLRALEIVKETLGNRAFAREIELVRAEVARGKLMSEAMNECRYFTPVIVEATAVGEKSGSLDEMLEGMAQHYDLEVSHTLKNLTTLLEPILLVFLFGMITLFALAVFLPIWNMSKVVGG